MATTLNNTNAGEGYMIVEDFAFPDITVKNPGTLSGAIVQIPITTGGHVGDVIIYKNENILQFEQSSNTFYLVPIKNILLLYTGTLV